MLLAGNDALAREAVDLLEELARKGRSYGIHLVLASQSMTGIEALYGRAEAIFGQFALRWRCPVAAGARPAQRRRRGPADRLRRGQQRRRRGRRRHRTALSRRPRRRRGPRRDTPRPVAGPPAGLAGTGGLQGYEAARIEDDTTFAGLRPGGRRPMALVGRTVDVHGTTALFLMDSTPAAISPWWAPHRPARTCCAPRR
ncbi:TraM recognition domain-containing protein [Micromonospora sp. M12]